MRYGSNEESIPWDSGQLRKTGEEGRRRRIGVMGTARAPQTKGHVDVLTIRGVHRVFTVPIDYSLIVGSTNAYVYNANCRRPMGQDLVVSSCSFSIARHLCNLVEPYSQRLWQKLLDERILREAHRWSYSPTTNASATQSPPRSVLEQ